MRPLLFCDVVYFNHTSERAGGEYQKYPMPPKGEQGRVGYWECCGDNQHPCTD